MMMPFIVLTETKTKYRTPSACAKRAAYPAPPPVVPDPESIAAQAAYTEALLPRSAPDEAYCPGRLRSELFPGIGLPGPATESHVVNKGTPVATLGQQQLNVPEKKSHTPARHGCTANLKPECAGCDTVTSGAIGVHNMGLDSVAGLGRTPTPGNNSGRRRLGQ